MGDPITTAILIGAATGIGTSLIGMYQANKQAEAVAKAQKKSKDQAVKNQNRLVEEGFAKKRQAAGLGMQQGAATGLTASQTGSVLTSVSDGNQASGL